MNRITVAVIVVGVVLSTQACGEDPPADIPIEVNHSDIRADMDRNLEGILPDEEALPALLEESELFNDLFGEECEGEGEEDDCGTIELPTISGEDLTEVLMEDFLTDENIEVEEPFEVIYKIDTGFFCDEEDSDSDDEAPCEPPFEAFRLGVSSRTAGVYDIDVLIGPERLNPVDLRVAPGSLSASVDLVALREVLVLIQAESDEEVDLPEVMEGVVELALRAQAQVFVLSVAIQEPVKVKLDIEGEPLEIELAKSSPLGVLSVDLGARRITGLLDLGATDIGVPLEFLVEDETCEGNEVGEEVCAEVEQPEGSLMIHLGGINGALDFEIADDIIHLGGAGLGDETTTVHYRDERVIGVDVNADHGRTFGMVLDYEEGGFEVHFEPALDISVDLDMQHTGVEVSDWMIEEDLRVLLNGEGPAIRVADEQIEIISGRMLLSSTSLDDLQAEAGRCLLFEDEEGRDASEEVDHLFSGIEAGACRQ